MDEPASALYQAAVRFARQPRHYLDGGVPDTVDGRFDMIATTLATVMLRLEADGPGTAALSTRLAELFVDDMDGQLREMGVGDIVVGKHIGKMMSLLGGRLGALRSAFAGDDDLAAALTRNLYAGTPPAPVALAASVAAISGLRDTLAALPTDAVIAAHWVDAA